MEHKTVKTEGITNYKKTIIDLIQFTSNAPYKSPRWNMNQRLKTKYYKKDQIQFFKHNGQFKHFIGQLKTAPARWMRKKSVTITRIYIYLKPDGSIDWNFFEFKS